MNTLDYLRFVISDSVDKRVELNKRSLDVRNSGSEKHERHDQLAIMDSCVRTMHTMRDSSKQKLQSIFLRVLQPSTLSTYYGFKSTNNIMQYFYSLTQHKLLTENAVVLQLKAITPQTDNRISSPRGFRWITRKLTKCSPTLNDKTLQ